MEGGGVRKSRRPDPHDLGTLYLSVTKVAFQNKETYTAQPLINKPVRLNNKTVDNSLGRDRGGERGHKDILFDAQHKNLKVKIERTGSGKSTLI